MKVMIEAGEDLASGTACMLFRQEGDVCMSVLRADLPMLSVDVEVQWARCRWR